MLKLIRLEERIVLDGAMVDAAADTGAIEFLADATEALQEFMGEAFQQVAPTSGDVRDGEQKSLDIILISSDLDDIQQLVAAAQPGAYVHVFDANDSSTDVLARVGDFATQQDLPISNLAIVTHGDAGSIHFGASEVTNASLASQGDAWQNLGQQMSADATLQVYGCNVAANADGVQLVENLAALTGADVQASDDLTGKSGDWQLEVASSATDVIALLDGIPNYAHSLDAPSVVTNEGVTVAESSRVQLTTDMLQSVDPDPEDGPEDVRYVIQAAPTGSTILLRDENDPTQFQNITDGQSFTQADIDNGRVFIQHNGNEETTDSFTFIVRDTFSTSGDGESTFEITITPVNDVPVLDLDTDPGQNLGGYRGTFDEDGTPVPVSNAGLDGVEINDVDSTVMSGATITLINPFPGADETFIVEGQLPNGITAEPIATGPNGEIILQLTGDASVEDYEQAIQSVRYVHGDGDGSTPNRNITITVTDDQGAESLESGTILVQLNTAPEIDAPDTASVDEDNPLVFDGTDAGVISISDPDARDNPVQVTLNASNGAIELSGVDGLTFTDADGSDGTLTFTGSLADINAALNGLQYTPDQDYNGPATIDIRVDDLGNNGDVDGDEIPNEPVDDNLFDEHTINVTVDAVNDPPVLNFPPPPAQQVNEDTTFKIPDLSVNDVDAEDGDLTVELNVSNGILEIDVASSGVTVTAGQSGTDMVTFTGTLEEINAALASVCYTGDLHFNGDDVLNFIVDDDGNTGAGDDTTLTGQVEIEVLPINDAPTVTVPAAQTTDEDMSIEFSAANGTGITVADLDANEDPDADSRDVQITLSVAGGALALGSTAGLTLVDGDGSDGSLVFQGTLVEVNAALDTLSYTPNDNFNGDDQLSVRIDDLSNFGDAPDGNDNGTLNEPEDNLFAVDTVDITVNPVNDAPEIDLDPGDLSGATGDDFQNIFREGDGLENGDPVPVADPNVSISDDDGEPIQSLVLTITNLQDGAAEVLAFDPDALPDGVTGVYDPDTGTLTFDGPASPEEYEALLATVTYQNTDQDPTAGDRVITVDVSDGTDTTTANATITVVPVNDAPDITPPSNTFVEEETTTTLNDVQVTDLDAGDENIRVTLTVDTGTLNVPDNDANVTVTSSGANGETLTLVGTQTDINAQLENLTYTPPTNFTGDVTFDLNVNDLGNGGEGGQLTDDESVTLTVGPVNDPPVATVPGPQTVAEDESIIITGVSVADVDAQGEDVVVTLSVTQGTLTVDGSPNVQIDGNGGGTITLTGSIDDINAVIDAITYQGDLNFNGDDVLTVGVNDQGNTGNGGPLSDTETVAITVTPVDDPPVIDPNGPDDPNDPDGNDPYTNTFTENGPPVSAVDPDNITIADPDGDDIGSAIIQLGVLDAGEETLAIDPDTLPPGVEFNYDPTTGTATITGNATAEQYEAILATLTYENTSEDPNPANRDITFTITDENGTTSEPSNSVIQVVPVNDAPVVTVPGAQDATEDTETPIPGVSVSDIDDRGQPIQVTVSADNGTLSVPPTAGVTIVGDDSGNLVLQGSEDDINAALAGLTYTGNPNFDGADTITVTANDLGNTGQGGALTDTQTIDVNVIGENDPPAVTTNPVSYPDGGTVVIGPDDLLAVDPDHDPNQLTFQVINPPEHGQILLNGVPLQLGQTFTQEDINNGLVSYQSNGDAAEDDAFTFTVTDGDGATVLGQLNLVEQDDFVPDAVDYFDPSNPVPPTLPPGPVGADAPPPFEHSVPPLEPLVPQTDLFQSALDGLDHMGGELEDTLLQSEFTNMQAGSMIMGTAGALGEGAPEIRYACSLLEVLDAGCRFNDAFDQPDAHLKAAQGHVVGNYFNDDSATVTPNGAVAALGMAVDVFQNCGDANQPPGDYAQSYLNGVVGGENECATGESGVSGANAASPVTLTGYNAAMPEAQAEVEIIPNDTNPRETDELRESMLQRDGLSMTDSQNIPAVAAVSEPDVVVSPVPNDVQYGTNGDLSYGTNNDAPYDLNKVAEVVVEDNS